MNGKAGEGQFHRTPLALCAAAPIAFARA